MATLFLICGLPASGKTTRAKRLEQEHAALRLTPDEWIVALGLDPLDDSKRAAVEAQQWLLAARALELGMNVVLDFGVWSRSERDSFRARAHALGAHVVLHFLDVSREELRRRLKARGAERTPAFYVDDAQLDSYFAWLERPTPEELT
jgi:predicted kinase